jgi:hypothetical protein
MYADLVKEVDLRSRTTLDSVPATLVEKKAVDVQENGDDCTLVNESLRSGDALKKTDTTVSSFVNPPAADTPPAPFDVRVGAVAQAPLGAPERLPLSPVDDYGVSYTIFPFSLG